MWIESIDKDNNKNYTRMFDGVAYTIHQRVKSGRVIWQGLKNGVAFNWSDNLDTVKSYIENIYRKPVKVGDTVHRKWGYYEILAMGEGFLVKKLVFNPNMAISYQFHTYRRETWTIIKGNGTFRTEKCSPFYDYFGSWSTYHNPMKSYLSPPPRPLIEVNEAKKVGDVIDIAVLQKHKFTAGSEGAEVIEVWSGSKLDEDDITRIDEV